MRAAILALVSAAAMLALSGGAPAAAHQLRANDSTPTATVAPSTGLNGFQIVNLSWSGFAPNGIIYVEECASDATSQPDQCVPGVGDPTQLHSDSTGSGVVRYAVAEGDLTKITCDDTHKCSLDLMVSPPDLNSGPHVPLNFAPAPGPCPNSTELPVSGEGASPAAYTMYAWQAAGCKTKQKLNVTYTNDDSYDGMNHLVNGLAQFAVTGVQAPADVKNPLAKKSRKFAYAPLTLTGLAIGYNIVDANGNQITNLVLTPHILAEIATNALSSFYCPAKASDNACITKYGSDPEIRKLNPGVQFPTGPIQFSIRAEQSASNWEFTSWLSATANDVWTYGPATTWPPPGTPPDLPPGTSGEATAARGVGFPVSYSPQDVYIGVMDTTDAMVNDIPVAKIENPGQADAVAPTAATIAAGVAAGTKNSDGTITPDYTTTAADTYPIPMLTYAVVPTNQGWPGFSADNGKMLAAFIDYATNADEGQKILPPGSFPLPGPQVAEAQSVAKEIPTTEPTTGGGHHHHHHHSGGGKGNGNGNGNGNGSGNGSGGTLPQTTCCSSTGNTTTPPPPAANSGTGPSTTPPPPPANNKGVGSGLPAISTKPLANIAAPSSSALQPILITLAIVGLLIAPIAWMLSRRDEPFDLSSAINSIKHPRRAR